MALFGSSTATPELTDGEGLSNRQTAAMLGVSEGTVRADKGAAQNYVPNDSEQMGLAGKGAQNYAPPPAPTCWQPAIIAGRENWPCRPGRRQGSVFPLAAYKRSIGG